MNARAAAVLFSFVLGTLAATFAPSPSPLEASLAMPASARSDATDCAANLDGLAAPLVAMPATAAEVAQDPAAKPFRHEDHVPKAWVRSATEFWRDCRGCHRFDEKHLVSSPQDECSSCHIANSQGPTLQPRYLDGWQKNLSGHKTRTRDAFRHHTHAMLECRECHLPEKDDFTAADPWLNTGPGQCVRCHDPSRVNADVVANLKWFQGALDRKTAGDLGLDAYELLDVKQALAKRLVDVFADPAAGVNKPALPPGGNFDHGDHVGIDCAQCHTNIPTANAKQVGTGAIPTEGCKQCHFDAQKNAVRTGPAGKPTVRALASLGTFEHADHYRWKLPGGTRKPADARVCSDAAYTQIEQGCATCHTYAPNLPGRGDRDFPFGEGKSRESYLGCMTCHDVAGWSTGESKQQPRHASSGAPVAANQSHWSDCLRCHEFGTPDLAKVRPTEAVERLAERTFVFPANTHPDITRIGTERATAAGRPAAKDCVECHRARVPQLSSRLQQKAFTHASHLAKDAGPAACLECHPSAGTAADSHALAGGDRRTYTLQSCTKCHWGGDVVEAEGPAPTKRPVVHFPHGPHVDKAKLSCVECHAPGTDGRDITTKPAAMQCNQCHDHQDGGPKTEALFGAAVTSCARCHDDNLPPVAGKAVASVPPVRGSEAAANDARYRAQQNTFAGFVDSQFHPLGVACSECHKANDLKPVGLPVAVHVNAVRPDKRSVHSDAGFSAPADCLRCHWRPSGQSWTSAVSGSTGDPGDKALRRDPEGERTRKLFGNAKDGYPGSERAKG